MAIGDQLNSKDSKTFDIRIFTLNIWGIPYISSFREERIQAVAEQIASSRDLFHYVFLQEVWSKKDYKYIAEKVKKVLPYTHYFYSGVIGSGCCILSSTPIFEVYFQPYSLNGYPYKVFHGDWYGGKGVCVAKTKFNGVPINLITTHFHAEYSEKRDEYLGHRTVQAMELSQLLRFMEGDNGITILGGDFNCRPESVPYNLFLHNSDAVDTYHDCAVKTTDGATSETPGNSFTSASSLKHHPDGLRIDYIFYKAAKSLQVKTLVHEHPLPPRVPQTNYSFSDHEGVKAVLSVKRKHKNEEDSKPATFNRTDALLEASAVCVESIRKVANKQKYWSWCSTFLFLLQLVVLGLVFWDFSGFVRFLLSVLLLLLCTGSLFFGVMSMIYFNGEFSSLLSAEYCLEKLLCEVRTKNAKYFYKHGDKK